MLDRTLGLRRNRPTRLTVFDNDAGTEVYLAVEMIRSAYLVDIGPDQRIVER